MQRFSADPSIFSKRKLNLFFAHENMEKLLSKINNRPHFFSISTARLPQLSAKAEIGNSFVYYVINV